MVVVLAYSKKYIYQDGPSTKMLFQFILLNSCPTFCGPFAFDNVSDPIVVIDDVSGGLKFRSTNTVATISIPPLDGYVIVTESGDGDGDGGDNRASLFYVYCIPVPNPRDRITKAEIVNKIEKYFPWRSSHGIVPPGQYWRLKCLKHPDGQLVAG